MGKKSLGKNFLILSLSGVVIKVLSALYVPILRRIIGVDAYGVYGASYSIFIFILAITSMGAQPAITKVVSEFRAIGNNKDSLRTMILAKKYLILIGGTITILFIFFAKPIASIMKWEQATISIIFLAPTILFSCILSAYRGYLQGIEEMKIIAISQIIEQLANIIFSLFFAKLLIDISLELGVAGGTIGSSLGAITAIIFIHFNKKPYQEEYINANKIKKTNTDKKIIKKLLVYALPITSLVAMQNASGLVDTSIVKIRLLAVGFSNNDANTFFGILNSYNTILYVPLAIITSLSAAIFPKIIIAFTEKNRKELKSQINYVYKLIFMITIPSTIGLSILSKEIYLLIFGEIQGYKLMLFGSIVLIFMSLTTIQNTIFQGINKLHLILQTAFVGVIIKVIVNFLLVGIKDLNIFGAVIATLLSFLIPTIINHIKIKKIFKIKIYLKSFIILPFVSSIFMTLVVNICKIIFEKVINIIEGERLIIAIEVIILITIGISIYLVCMIIIGGIRKKDLDFLFPSMYKLLPKFIQEIMQD
ncbi:polysaccharide biosynthesis protein [Clostridium sp. Sa3CUN1]|uniref:Polysaccharide biosynthesis protein n=1 Tax=Clostridium gallinarum TaxID=2762246 RepID=A0ABR8Q709_9CLOT|nr:polysaccharide biosynthesis protein [Clostridium gallinarum]MBD7916222.1 polysaccharide biosynthesis protein [Clostridium gallinarum]